MHSKLLLVDGAVGITGGRNYADDYYDWSSDYDFRDRDVLIAGPAAREMSANFDAFWDSPRSRPVEELKDVGRRLLRWRAGACRRRRSSNRCACSDGARRGRRRAGARPLGRPGACGRAGGIPGRPAGETHRRARRHRARVAGNARPDRRRAARGAVADTVPGAVGSGAGAVPPVARARAAAARGGVDEQPGARPIRSSPTRCRTSTSAASCATSVSKSTSTSRSRPMRRSTSPRPARRCRT